MCLVVNGLARMKDLDKLPDLASFTIIVTGQNNIYDLSILTYGSEASFSQASCHMLLCID